MGSERRIPELRSAMSMPVLRTITSRFSPFGSSGTEELGAGRLSWRMFVLENTAVNSRKNTRITIMSIIGTMLRSLRPRYLAWLRTDRAASLDEAIACSSAGSQADCGPYQLGRTGSGGTRGHRRGRGRGGGLRVTLRDRVQELDHGDLQAVDQRGGLGLQEHVRQQQRDGDEQTRGRVVH